MTVRLFAAVVAICCAALSVRAADEDNPYKNAKVGDFATYKMSMKVAGFAVAGTTTQKRHGQVGEGSHRQDDRPAST